MHRMELACYVNGQHNTKHSSEIWLHLHGLSVFEWVFRTALPFFIINVGAVYEQVKILTSFDKNHESDVNP